MNKPARALTGHALPARFLAAGALALTAALAAPLPALAANDDTDITLSVNFTSEADVTDTVYASYDGERFYAIDTPYRDSTPGSTASSSYSGNHVTHKDPDILYHDGYFWMASAWNRWNGTMWPMISYSRDLVHWTHPEGNQLLSADSTHGVTLDSLPTVNGQPLQGFDVVAPKFTEAPDGTVWLTFCAGFYGDFHGQPMRDQMQVYVARVDQLSANGGSDAGDGYLWPNGLTFKAETAKKASFSNHNGANYIDSNMYFEGLTAYLLVKSNGLTEQIYRSNTPDDPNSWQLVNGRASFGYEGVSINKANGIYHLYGDGVAGTKPLGIRAVTSASITRGDQWRDARSAGNELLHQPVFLSETGSRMAARHGDAITLKAGTSEWRLVKSMLDPKVSAYFDFEDTQGHWAHNTILRAYNLGVMSGYGGAQAGLFGPEVPLKREEAASTFYKRLGNGAAAPSAGKSDVRPGDWYATAVNWAIQQGIAGGIGGTNLFGAGRNISREDLAIMIGHAAKVSESEAAAVDPSVLNKLSDGNAVDSYARSYVAWAVQNGIMGNGKTLNARGPVVRSEMAAMMVNAIDKGLL